MLMECVGKLEVEHVIPLMMTRNMNNIENMPKESETSKRRHDIRHNDAKLNGIKHSDAQLIV